MKSMTGLGASFAAVVASFGFTAGSAFASVLDICDVTARVKSIEELSVMGAGSRKIVSELDPSQVRFNSFVTMMSLEIIDAIPYAPPSTECSLERDGQDQKVVLHSVPDDLLVGDQIKLVRELYVDLTPDGVVYEMIWTIPFDRKP